jgi:hypothetical protein
MVIDIYHLILLKRGYYSLEYYALLDECSFYNQFIYNENFKPDYSIKEALIYTSI